MLLFLPFFSDPTQFVWEYWIRTTKNLHTNISPCQMPKKREFKQTNKYCIAFELKYRNQQQTKIAVPMEKSSAHG